jgi:sulfur carrier protein ThiS
MHSVEVIPVGTLKRRLGGHELLLVEPGQSVQELLAALSVRSRSVVVIVNGSRVTKSYVLEAGDRVRLLPLIGGG